MKQYQDLVRHVLTHGISRDDRTGTGTIGVFGYQMRFNLEYSFPLITTKKMFWRGIVHELLWMLSGDTNVQGLQKRGVHIWDEWADEKGELGPVYGEQWRSWPSTSDGDIDQIAQVIHDLRENPYSRRHIVSAWNVGEVPSMSLPPCHLLFQFYVAEGKLSCQLYQRSADIFLGVPFNIASYALLTHMVAHVVGLQPGEFIHTLGDAHIYHNHASQMAEQLVREPQRLPTLHLNPLVLGIDDFTFHDIALVGYVSHPPLKGEVSV